MCVCVCVCVCMCVCVCVGGGGEGEGLLMTQMYSSVLLQLIKSDGTFSKSFAWGPRSYLVSPQRKCM